MKNTPPRIVKHKSRYVVSRLLDGKQHLWDASRGEWIDPRDILIGGAHGVRCSYFGTRYAAQKQVDYLNSIQPVPAPPSHGAESDE
jgi:hypothetical protein